MLAWTIYISFAAAALLLVLPGSKGTSRVIALAAAGLSLLIGLVSFALNPGGEMRTVIQVPWIPSLGISYHLAADGISLVLVVLTGLAAVAGILFSWNVEKN